MRPRNSATRFAGAFHKIRITELRLDLAVRSEACLFLAQSLALLCEIGNPSAERPRSAAPTACGLWCIEPGRG